MFNLHSILCAQEASELQKLSALNGIMGLLGSEQGLFIVSYFATPNALQITDKHLFLYSFHASCIENVLHFETWMFVS